MTRMNRTITVNKVALVPVSKVESLLRKRPASDYSTDTLSNKHLKIVADPNLKKAISLNQTMSEIANDESGEDDDMKLQNI